MLIRRILRATIAVAVIGAGSVGLTAPASASVPTHHATSSTLAVDSGRTSLRIDRATAGVLADNGVTVTAIANASGAGRRFSFPIVDGSVDPATAAGTIEHSGGLRFTAGGTSLGVQDFVIDTTSGVLTARVSGTSTRVPLLVLDTSGASIKATKNRLTVRNVRASLTGAAAAALNATFHVDLFTAGLPIGTATVRARG